MPEGSKSCAKCEAGTQLSETSTGKNVCCDDVELTAAYQTASGAGWPYSPCHLQSIAKSSLSKVLESKPLCYSHYANQEGVGWSCMKTVASSKILGRSKSDLCTYLQAISTCFPPSCCVDFGSSNGLAWPPEEILERSGLKWTRAGSAAPADGLRELENSQLASKLLILPDNQTSTGFAQKEWDAFGIIDLRIGDYIRAGSFYFTPAAVEGDCQVIRN